MSVGFGEGLGFFCWGSAVSVDVMAGGLWFDGL